MFFVSCLLCSMLTAQISKSTVAYDRDAIVCTFQQRFEVLDSLMATACDSVMYHASGLYAPATERVDQVDQTVEAQVDLYKSRNGLDLNGHLYARPVGGMGYDSEEPSGAYTAKAQLELRWNIFQSSLLKRADRIREYKLQGEIEQLEFEKEQLTDYMIGFRLDMLQEYNSKRLGVLRHLSENLHLLTDAQTYLLRQGSISSDDIIRNITEQADVDRQIAGITADETVTAAPCSAACIIIEIDSAALTEYIGRNHMDIRRTDMEIELADCRTQSISWFEQATLYPFVRYSWYARTASAGGSMSNLDAGIGFSIPLSSETRNRRRVQNAQKELIEYRRNMISQQIATQVSNILRELDSYNRNITAQTAQLITLKDYTAQRINSYNNAYGEYDILQRLQEYNSVLNAWLKLLEYEYQRDLKLTDLQSYVTDMPISSFFK